MKLLLVLALAWAAWWWLKPKRTPVERARLKARAVLGVGLRADADEVRAAYRRLAARHHPDRGGSAALLRRVTEARDLLLGGG